MGSLKMLACRLDSSETNPRFKDNPSLEMPSTFGSAFQLPAGVRDRIGKTQLTPVVAFSWVVDREDPVRPLHAMCLA